MIFIIIDESGRYWSEKNAWVGDRHEADQFTWTQRNRLQNLPAGGHWYGLHSADIKLTAMNGVVQYTEILKANLNGLDRKLRLTILSGRGPEFVFAGIQMWDNQRGWNVLYKMQPGAARTAHSLVSNSAWDTVDHFVEDRNELLRLAAVILV